MQNMHRNPRQQRISARDLSARDAIPIGMASLALFKPHYELISGPLIEPIGNYKNK